MLRPYTRRLLLLLPTTTYRTAAFVEAARRLGVELTVASERPSTFEGAQPAAFLTLDFAAPERAAEQAAEFARRHPVAGVVGVDDDTAVVAAAIAGRLELTGNPVAAALAARDKHMQRVELARHGAPVPRFELHGLGEDVTDFAARLRYPCVLKPLRLAASRGVIRADDPAGFAAAFQRVGRILAQPDVVGCGDWTSRVLVEDFIPGPEVALEGLVVAGRLHVLALFDKPDPLDGPFFEESIYTTPSRLPTDVQQAIAHIVSLAAASLQLREGPVHAELRVNDQGPWMLEIAGRSIGGLCSTVLEFGSGMCLEELILRQAIGDEITSIEREGYAAGVMMIPIPTAGMLKAVYGVDDALTVPQITGVEITAKLHHPLVPLPEGASYLGFIFARGDSPAEVETA